MAEIRDFTATPSDLELLEFFESEPVEVVPEDGYWCYEFADGYNVGVRLSCNVLEKSVQTVLLVNGDEIETVVYEGAEELTILEHELHARFDLGSDSRLVVQLKPRVTIRWSSLRKS
ncbi:MAG: hypothetical protein ACK5SI_03015 [Planctomycetia bacterium]|jgi:hypothetical protein